MIPKQLKEEIFTYVHIGCINSHFLKCVFSNELKESLGASPFINVKDLHELILYLYVHTPKECRGSRLTVTNWIKNQGAWGKFNIKKKRHLYPNLK